MFVGVGVVPSRENENRLLCGRTPGGGIAVIAVNWASIRFSGLLIDFFADRSLWQVRICLNARRNSRENLEYISGFIIEFRWPAQVITENTALGLAIHDLQRTIMGAKMKKGVQLRINTPTTIERVRAALCSCMYRIIWRDFSRIPPVKPRLTDEHL